MSYGPSVDASFRRAAALVDKVLKGAKPAEIPVEQPTKFELVINLRTAQGPGPDDAARAAAARGRSHPVSGTQAFHLQRQAPPE